MSLLKKNQFISEQTNKKDFYSPDPMNKIIFASFIFYKLKIA